MNEHEAICQLKDLALDLGRTPTRNEARKIIKGMTRLLAVSFGGQYQQLIRAADLEPVSLKRKVDQSIWVTDIDSHLENQIQKLEPRSKPYPSIASISDIHWPFSNQLVIDRFVEYCRDVKPDHIFINGDAWDMYSHTKFPRSHNVFTPRDEQASARKSNELFWKLIKKASPKSKCVQMMGNHDVRPLKRIMENYPEAEDWIVEKLTALFTYPGVTTIMDAREEYKIEDILIFHGYRSKLGDHRDFTLANTINGHTHLGGVVFRRVRDSVIWELNSGFAGNAAAKGLTYTSQKQTIWTPGFGAVDKLGPRFIPV